MTTEHIVFSEETQKHALMFIAILDLIAKMVGRELQYDCGHLNQICNKILQFHLEHVETS